MNILITGGSGFIGGALLRKINSIHQHSKIYLLEGPSGAIHISPDFKSIKISELINSSHDIDVIIHLAQSRNYNDPGKYSDEIFQSNLLLTQKLLEFGKNNKIKKFIYMSTSSVYKNSGSLLMEDSELKSASLYSYTKLSSEGLIELYSNHFNFLIFRLFFPFGRGMGDKFLNRIKRNVELEKTIYLGSETGFKFNPVFIKDIVEILFLSIFYNESGIYNIAGNESISLKDFSLSIGELLNKEPIFEISENFLSLDCIGSNTKLRNEFNYIFTPIYESIKNFCLS